MSVVFIKLIATKEDQHKMTHGFNKDEIDCIQRAFTAADTNRSGRISAKELGFSHKALNNFPFVNFLYFLRCPVFASRSIL